MQAFEIKEKTSCIFLDFVKAFDTVSHETLMSKLEHYCIRGPLLFWFKSYLTDRKQAVKNHHLWNSSRKCIRLSFIPYLCQWQSYILVVVNRLTWRTYL